MPKKETKINPINQWDAANAKHVMDEIAVALAPIVTGYGLHLKQAGATYSDLDLRTRFTLRVEQSADGVPADRLEWNKHCGRRGLKPDDFGEKFFSLQNVEYQIVGIKPKARKFSVIVLCVEDGKKYVWSAREVAKYLVMARHEKGDADGR